MARNIIRDPKTRTLRQETSLHPHPEQVTDELFSTQEFFDPRDVVQSAGTDATEARTEASAQTHCRSVALLASGTAGRSLPTSDCIDFAGPREIRITVHPRSIERALARSQKKRR
jgi:hypothetical protein